jgi:hypothetical protein
MNTPAPDNEIVLHSARGVETEPKKSFKRQLVLIDEVKKHQLDCDHEIVMANSTTLICKQCGALWIK